jgi:hypothetical protein
LSQDSVDVLALLPRQVEVPLHAAKEFQPHPPRRTRFGRADDEASTGVSRSEGPRDKLNH